MIKNKIVLWLLTSFLTLTGLLIVISFLFPRPVKKTTLHQSGYPSVSISDNSGMVKASFVVELATTSAQQAKGLMNRSALPEDRGMFFIFPEEKKLSFWMKNTLISLDMIYFDRNRKIVHIINRAQPCRTESCPSYTSPEAAQYVLEINAGLSQKYKLEENDKIDINF